MVRILRASFWASPDDQPLTAVYRDCDLGDTIENTRILLLERTGGTGYLHTEISSMASGGDIEAATAHAFQIRDPEREANMALLFFWAKGTLRSVRADGSLVTTRPAPLTAEELASVLSQVVASDAYRGQNIHTIAEDGQKVAVKAGEIING